MNRRLLFLPPTFAVVAAIVLGACTSTSPGTSVAIPSVPAVVIPTVSIPPITLPSIVIPSLAPGESITIPTLPPGGASFAIPTFHAAPDLEAVLPSQLRGVTLEKASYGGDLFLSGTSASPELQALLAQFGKQPSDLTIAGASDPSGGLKFSLFVFRLAGVDAQQLLGAFLQAAATSASAPPVISQATIGGKAVTVATDANGTKSYVYPKSEFLFVAGSDATDADALINDIFTALP